MTFLLKIFKGPITKLIIRELKKEEFRSIIVYKINKEIDIPKLTEKEETKFLNAIYDAIQEAIVTALSRT